MELQIMSVSSTDPTDSDREELCDATSEAGASGPPPCVRIVPARKMNGFQTTLTPDLEKFYKHQAR